MTRRRFCPYSLGDWLAVCRETGVPHVPADLVCEFERNDLLEYETEGPHQVRLADAGTEVMMRLEEGYMFRWDCCAPARVKAELARGRHEWQECLTMAESGDIECTYLDYRSADIILDWPRFTVPVWKRPWQKAWVVDGWPVEFRAFVMDDRIQGVSSYYPQRPLDDNAYIRGVVDRVRLLTGELLAAVRGREFEWSRAEWKTPPPPANGFVSGDVLDRLIEAQEALKRPQFTCDFMVTPDDEVLFLEGGPPHWPTGGAHPCCFAPGHTEGVALGNRGPAEGIYRGP